MKPLRPFPLPLGVGTDICRISRIHAILGSARARRFIDRVLTPEERARAEPRLRLRPEKQVAADHAAGDAAPARRVLGHEEMARRDPVLWATASFVAGRFAAKEAAIKAHRHRRLTFHDIELQHAGAGSAPPSARIKGESDAEEDASALISISHDGDYATAVCVVIDDPSAAVATSKRAAT